MKKLTTLYEEYGFPSLQRFWNIVKERGIKITRKKLMEFIEKQKTHQFHKQAPKIQQTPITTGNVRNELQMDLLDMTKFYHSNSGYKWILIMVDVFSRKAFAVALKSKTAEDTLEGIKSIFKQSGIPKIIDSDNGSEFKGPVTTYFKSLNILHKMNDPQDHNVLGIIDRFSRTLKTNIYKYFTFKDTTKWIDYLPKIIAAYNKTKHNTIKVSPNLAEKYISDTRNTIYELVNKVDRKNINLKVGDTVRVLKQKQIFDKGYTIKWSLKTYTIVAKHGLRYELDDGNSYRADRLQKVSNADLGEKKDLVKIAHKQRKKEVFLKQEGIEPKNEVRQLRSRKPQNQLISDKYGKIFYS